MTAVPNAVWFKMPATVPYCTRLLLAEFKSVCQTMVMEVGVTICKYGSRTTAAVAGRAVATNKQRITKSFIILKVSPISGGELDYNNGGELLFWGYLFYDRVASKKTGRKNSFKN